MATTIHARGEVSFAKFLFLPTWFAKLLEDNFSSFAIDGSQVDLPNCWSWSPKAFSSTCSILY
jgi:hypothetical protein